MKERKFVMKEFHLTKDVFEKFNTFNLAQGKEGYEVQNSECYNLDSPLGTTWILKRAFVSKARLETMLCIL